MGVVVLKFWKNLTPPAPVFTASCWPRADAWSGTTSAIRVGRFEILFFIHRKSRSSACVPLCNLILLDFCCWRANWRWLNKFRDLGSAMAIDRNSPSIWCDGGMESNISRNRSWRWGDKLIVWFWVLMSQPKIVFYVSQEQSPFFNFLTEIGSWQNIWSYFSSGRKASSMEFTSMFRV